MKRIKKWNVYIIEADNGHLYTGITTDLERRFQEHQGGGKGAKFFRSCRPQQIVYSEKYSDRSSASKREAEIKKMTRLDKLNLMRS